MKMRALPLSLSLLLVAIASSAQALSPVSDEQLADETGQAGLTVTVASPVATTGITASSIKLQDDGNDLTLGSVAWQSLNGSGVPGGQFKYSLLLDAATPTASPTNPELRLSLNQALSRQRLTIGNFSAGNGVNAGSAVLDFEGNVNLLARMQRSNPFVLSGSLSFTPTNSHFRYTDDGTTMHYSGLNLALALGRAEFNLETGGLRITLPSGNTNKLDVTFDSLAITDASVTVPTASDRAWAGTLNLDIDNAWWLLQGQGSDGSQGLSMDGYIKFKNSSGITFYDAAPGTVNRSYGFRQLTGSVTLNDASVDVTSNGLTMKMPDIRSTNDVDTLRFDSLEIGGNKLGSMQFRNFQSSLEFTVAGHN